MIFLIQAKTDSFHYFYNEEKKCIIVSPDQTIFEQFIFQTTEKIIDDLVEHMFQVVSDNSCPSNLTVKEFGLKLIEKIKKTHLENSEPLTERQQQFRACLVEKALSILKAPILPHLRQEIVLAMEPEDKLCIEAIATKWACQLLAKLDAGSPEIVNRLMKE